MEIFTFQDLTGEFTVMDVLLAMVLSFLLSAFIGWIYKRTHHGTSYSQSFVITLVMNGMVVALIMMVVGSNIARAFSLVGALSIIRFRNAVKETRDVGFIFFSMTIGMAVGTKFYTLAAIATVVISLMMLIMTSFNWFASNSISQLMRVQMPNSMPFESIFSDLFLKYANVSELISVDSVQSGMLTECTYRISMKKQGQVQEFLTAIKQRNGNHKVTFITGYNSIDL